MTCAAIVSWFCKRASGSANYYRGYDSAARRGPALRRAAIRTQTEVRRWAHACRAVYSSLRAAAKPATLRCLRVALN